MATRTCSVAMAQLQTWWNLTSQLLALLLQLHVHHRAPVVSNEYLKGQKIAYKFQTEWLTGTFRGKYKGKKDEFTKATMQSISTASLRIHFI